MNNNSVRKKLQGELKFNPFNETYSSNELKKFLEKYKKNSDVDIQGINIALTTEAYNSYYNEIMDFIDSKIQILNNDNWGIIQTVFAAANRDYYLINKKTISGTSIVSIKEMAKLEVESSIEHFGKMNAVGVLENSIDILNTLLNALRYGMVNLKTDLILEEDKGTEIVRLYGAANILCCIKESYDTALWEDGYIVINKDRYHIKYINEEYPIARKIGDIRMQNNILGVLNILEELSKKNKLFNKNVFEEKRKERILENVWLDSDGYIQYSLKYGKNNCESEMTCAMAVSEIDTYYPFMTDKVFSSMENLCLNDLVIMFSKVAALIMKINEKYMLGEVKENDLKNFLYKIELGRLFKYLKETTTFSEKQIESFFEIIESRIDNNSRINLWSRPVFRSEDTFYFLSTNTVSSNYAFLVDEWLDSIGYDLTERGSDFEKYIKRELGKCFLKHNFFYKIIDKNEFYVNKSENEEIDLLINLKNIVIIGEVKCIKYPMDSRGSHNNLKRLHDASNQIKRKAEFICKNRNFFAKDIGNIENKKIIKVIISNYAIFAGTKVDGIPVIDYYLFDSYIRSGKLTHTIKTKLADNSGYNVKSEEINYYSNEDEFCDNFERFIENPPSISELRDNLIVEAKELTLQGASIHIYQDFVQHSSK